MQDDVLNNSSGSINREGQKVLGLLNAVFQSPDDSTLKSAWTTPTLPGLTIGDEIGRGTFGIVYEATLNASQQRVAVKIARPEVAQSDQLRQRFLRECRVAQDIKHEGLVPIYDAGEANGFLYLVMDYCEGKTLSKLLQWNQSALTFHQIATVICQVAEAVGYGHQRGIVHRDLKPANIIVQTDATVEYQAKVVDFGLAFGIEDSIAQTQSSVLLGTPLYMAPEQVIGSREEIGPATDVFALGSILYQCLAGKAPFAADSIPHVFELIRKCEPVAPCVANSSIPKPLETICLHCLSHDVQDRYRNGTELADDLRRWMNQQPIQTKPPSGLSQLQRWLRRPSRVSEFGLGLVAINSLVLGWAILNYPLALLLDSLAQRETSQDPTFLPIVAIIIPVHGALWWSSFKIHRNTQTRQGVVIHLLFTLLIAVASIGTICFASQASTGNLDRFERVAALGLMSSFAEVQAILLVLLLIYSRLPLPKTSPEKT